MSEKTNWAEINREDFKGVEQGQKYRHYRGNIYEVLFTGYNEDDMALVVIYRKVSGVGPVWVRTLENFIEWLPVGPDEEVTEATKRFVLVED